MTVTLGDIVAYVRADDSKAQGDLRGFESKALNIIGGISKKLAIAVGAIVVGAAGAAIGFMASTIEPASDLNETVSKTKVVFGDSATAVLDFGSKAAEALGMSENSALAAAATYGNLFRAMEIGEETSAEMSTTLVTLAGDLASFNNMDPTEVLDKLRAGLSGETEPLKSLGVNLNQALIQEKALEMGLWDGVGALTAAEKAQASYALIMEQTTLAQGDFARTSEGLANQQRIMKARWEDLKATVGEKLLPVVTTFVGLISDFIARPEVAEFLQKIADKAGQIGDAFSYLFERLSGWGIDALFTKFEDGSSILGGFFERLGMGEEEAEALAGKIIEIAGVMREWVQGTLIPFVQTYGPMVAEWIRNIATVMGEWIQGTLIPFIQQHGPEIKAAFLAIAAVLAGSAIVSIIGAIGAALAALNLPLIAIIAVVALLAAAWAGNWGGIQEKTRAVIDFIRNAFQGFVSWILPLWEYWTAQIKAIFELFSLAFQGKWYEFGVKLREIWDRAWTALKEAAAKAWEAIKSFFRDTDWGQVGRNILEGIAKGILNGLRIIKDAAKAAAQAALEAAKGFLGIHSPSTRFESEVGEPSAEGFGAGFARKMGAMGGGAGAAALGFGKGLTPMPAMAGGGAPIQVFVNFDKPLTLYDERQVEQQLRPVFERLLEKKR